MIKRKKNVLFEARWFNYMYVNYFFYIFYSFVIIYHSSIKHIFLTVRFKNDFEDFYKIFTRTQVILRRIKMNAVDIKGNIINIFWAV